jgi:hypothetical protein
VRELWLGPRDRPIRGAPSRQESLETDTTQGNDDFNTIHETELADQITTTVLELPGERFVTGRGAPRHGSDTGIDEKESIIAAVRFGLAREAETMKRFVQPIARSVTGKHPSRPVGAMCSRCKTDDEQSSPRTSKGRDRFSPIRLMGKSFGFNRLNLLAMSDQTGAQAASHDFTSKLSHTLCSRRGTFRHHPLRSETSNRFSSSSRRVDSTTYRA